MRSIEQKSFSESLKPIIERAFESYSASGHTAGDIAGIIRARNTLRTHILATGESNLRSNMLYSIFSPDFEVQDETILALAQAILRGEYNGENQIHCFVAPLDDGKPRSFRAIFKSEEDRLLFYQAEVEELRSCLSGEAMTVAESHKHAHEFKDLTQLDASQTDVGWRQKQYIFTQAMKMLGIYPYHDGVEVSRLVNEAKGFSGGCMNPDYTRETVDIFS